MQFDLFLPPFGRLDRVLEVVDRVGVLHRGTKPNHLVHQSVADHEQYFLTLVVSPPKRLYYAEHTMQHLEERGFPEVHWLRSPDADEIAHLDPDKKAERRVMIIFYATVFPAVLKLSAERGIQSVFV